MITNHTRVECRVLCVLARGGRIVEIPGREGQGLYETGEKRNKAGQTRAEFFEAHGLQRGAEGTPTASRSDFVGAKVSFGQDLFDRLIASGWVTKKGAITKAGREHFAEVHSRACRVMDCVGHDDIHGTMDAFVAGFGERMIQEETDLDELNVILAETGFLRAGLSMAGCCQGAATIMSVIERLRPDEGV